MFGSIFETELILNLTSNICRTLSEKCKLDKNDFRQNYH